MNPGGFDIQVGADETLIEAAWRAGYYWPTICQGQGACLQCFIVVERGWDNLVAAGEQEIERLAHLGEHTTGDLRLACQVRLTGDVVVSRPGVKLQRQ